MAIGIETWMARPESAKGVCARDCGTPLADSGPAALCATTHARFAAALVLSIVAATLAGCGSSLSASFVPDTARMEGLVEKEQQDLERVKDAGGDLDAVRLRWAGQRQAVVDIVTALFGDPDQPRLPDDTGLEFLNLNLLRVAAGKTWSDEQGYKGGLYRRHCVHCHGISGDGKGPTALFLNPWPRDFRHGQYKFKSTQGTTPPTDRDLMRTLEEGVAGTAMPSFKLLSDTEKRVLVEYVKYLSIRGQVEANLMALAADDPEKPLWDGQNKLGSRARIAKVVRDVATEWKEAAGKSLNPSAERKTPTGDALAASIAKGRELFQGKGGCVQCHGPSGLGDGRRIVINEPMGRIADIENRVTNWTLGTQEMKPRNLRLGVYRGGRRPIDVYRRIRYGIGGTPMPGLGEAVASEEEVWNIVDYVLNLPYETPLPRELENQRIRN